MQRPARTIHICLSLLTGLSLQACEWLSKPSYLKQKMSQQQQSITRFSDYPRINLKIYQTQNSPRQKNNYVFDKINAYLQEQMAQHQNYSDLFYMQTLSKLPATQVASFAGYYLERELKLDGFGGYFKRTQGFLGQQALQGYQQQGLLHQAKLLQAATAIYAKQQASGAKTVNASDYRDLDQSWQAHTEQLLAQRAAYIEHELPGWIAQEPSREPTAEPSSAQK